MATRRATRPGVGAAGKGKSLPPPNSRSPSARRSRSSAPPLWVDEVGSGVTRMPGRAQSGVPRLAKGSNRDLAKAPLGPREAYLLSRIDGSASAGDLADQCGMPIEEVSSILERMV